MCPRPLYYPLVLFLTYAIRHSLQLGGAARGSVSCRLALDTEECRVLEGLQEYIGFTAHAKAAHARRSQKKVEHIEAVLNLEAKQQSLHKISASASAKPDEVAALQAEVERRQWLVESAQSTLQGISRQLLIEYKEFVLVLEKDLRLLFKKIVDIQVRV